MEQDYDYIIIGSGFGGSVSALRLSEKGYKVLVIEKGKWYTTNDFAKTNWQLSKWLWVPFFRWFGIMKLAIFRHVAILSGTGVGGGSLVYANTLPIPKSAFFNSGSWSELNDWQLELKPHYETALKMLGAAKTPKFFDNDLALKKLSGEIGKEDQFEATNVGVYFGKINETRTDPYFEGKGPDRTGCNFCGACMTGCRFNAKNSLDKNYLHLAQRLGAEILAENEVIDVVSNDAEDGSNGYTITLQTSTRFFKQKRTFKSKGVIFSGGVLGTVKLLLKLKLHSLPRLSDRIGEDIRTNNESLISVTSLDAKKDLSRGVAIGSILHTDEHSHLEVVRYGRGSGAWKTSLYPFVTGSNALIRIGKIFWEVFSHPIDYIKYLFVRDWAKSTSVMLFMQTLDSTLKFSKGFFGMKSSVNGNSKPTAFILEAVSLARRFEKILNGKSMAMAITPLMGTPGTAHILGGAVMGQTASDGVIDKNNHVFGYQNMLVCDGAMISANPGVNPSLSITAITEMAMSGIVKKDGIK